MTMQPSYFPRQKKSAISFLKKGKRGLKRPNVGVSFDARKHKKGGAFYPRKKIA